MSDRATTGPQEPSRRRLLTVGGASMIGGALGAGGLPVASADMAPAPRGLPVLPVGADWRAVLARTPQVQLEPGRTYVLDETVDLPSGCLLVGNGATVTVSSSVTALRVEQATDVTVRDLRLLGQSADPVNTAHVVEHVGIRISRSTNVRVTGCDFSTGAAPDWS